MPRHSDDVPRCESTDTAEFENDCDDCPNFGNSHIYSFVDDKYLRFYTINFYTGDRVKLFEKELPESGVVIVGEKDMKLLLEKYEGKYEFASIFRSDRRSCDRRQPIVLLQFFQKGGKQERL